MIGLLNGAQKLCVSMITGNRCEREKSDRNYILLSWRLRRRPRKKKSKGSVQEWDKSIIYRVHFECEVVSKIGPHESRTYLTLTHWIRIESRMGVLTWTTQVSWCRRPGGVLLALLWYGRALLTRLRTCGNHRSAGRLLPLARETARGMGYQATTRWKEPKEHTTAIAEAVYFGVPCRVSPSLYIYGTLTLPATTRTRAVRDSVYTRVWYRYISLMIRAHSPFVSRVTPRIPCTYGKAYAEPVGRRVRWQVIRSFYSLARFPVSESRNVWIY